MLKFQRNFYEKLDEIFEKFVKNSFMYDYLSNFRAKYSENFESEIHTKFIENFENIFGKVWGRFSKSIRKFCGKINKILGSLEQILEKFVGNIQLFFLQNLRNFRHSSARRKFKKIFARLFEKVVQKV